MCPKWNTRLGYMKFQINLSHSSMIKTKFSILLVSILILILPLSCRKVIQDVNHNAEKALKAIYDPPLYGSCFGILAIGQEYVINDSVAYKNLEDTMRNKTSPACDTAHFANIDFKSYTLIGKQVDLSLCDSISREITVNATQKKYVYIIRVKRHVGFCASVLKITMNWVLVPKLPDDYKVDFDYKEY